MEVPAVPKAPSISEANQKAFSTCFLERPKKVRKRRKASEIDRKFGCAFPACNRFYGTENALKMHINLKHPEFRNEKHLIIAVCDSSKVPSSPEKYNAYAASIPHAAITQKYNEMASLMFQSPKVPTGKFKLDPSSRCLPPPIPSMLQFQPQSPFDALLATNPKNVIAVAAKQMQMMENNGQMNLDHSALFPQGKLLQSEVEAEQALHLLCCAAH